MIKLSIHTCVTGNGWSTTPSAHIADVTREVCPRLHERIVIEPGEFGVAPFERRRFTVAGVEHHADGVRLIVEECAAAKVTP